MQRLEDSVGSPVLTSEDSILSRTRAPEDIIVSPMLGVFDHHISAHFLFWAPKAPKAPKAEITLMSVTFRERSFMSARKLGNRRVSVAAVAKASAVMAKALRPFQKLSLPDSKLY